MKDKSCIHRIFQYFLWMFICGICGTSCSSSTKKEQLIVVTIPPQKAWVEDLVGDIFKVHCMVPKGNSPESYDPTPSDLTKLSKACAYFRMGELGFEQVWMERLIKNNPQMKVFNSSQEIDFIKGEEPSGHHFHTHSHGGIDPHVWTSPKQLYIVAKNMLNFLIAMDSLHTSFYQKRYQLLLKKIKETDSIATEMTQTIPSKSFAIYHPSLSYFARDYGLEQIALEAEGKEPSAQHLLEMQQEMKGEGVKVVFIQQEFDRKNATLLAKENHCSLITINPLNEDWQGEIIRICKALQ